MRAAQTAIRREQRQSGVRIWKVRFDFRLQTPDCLCAEGFRSISHALITQNPPCADRRNPIRLRGGALWVNRLCISCSTSLTSA
jgi:hypothetical protein